MKKEWMLAYQVLVWAGALMLSISGWT
jgi:hypothetical protein